jgi:hypothetical protein
MEITQSGPVWSRAGGGVGPSARSRSKPTPPNRRNRRSARPLVSATGERAAQMRHGRPARMASSASSSRPIWRVSAESKRWARARPPSDATDGFRCPPIVVLGSPPRPAGCGPRQARKSAGRARHKVALGSRKCRGLSSAIELRRQQKWANENEPAKAIRCEAGGSLPSIVCCVGLRGRILVAGGGGRWPAARSRAWAAQLGEGAATLPPNRKWLALARRVAADGGSGRRRTSGTSRANREWRRITRKSCTGATKVRVVSKLAPEWRRNSFDDDGRRVRVQRRPPFGHVQRRRRRGAADVQQMVWWPTSSCSDKNLAGEGRRPQWGRRHASRRPTRPAPRDGRATRLHNSGADSSKEFICCCRSFLQSIPLRFWFADGATKRVGDGCATEPAGQERATAAAAAYRSAARWSLYRRHVGAFTATRRPSMGGEQPAHRSLDADFGHEPRRPFGMARRQGPLRALRARASPGWMSILRHWTGLVTVGCH